MFDLGAYFPITDPTWIFFIVLSIILFAPMIMAKLRIPHIIGMVLAGVLVGKYGLNILQRDASFEIFGQVGLYFIMFLAGLEMDMEGTKKHLGKMTIFGLLTFFVPFIMVYYAGINLLHYSRQTTLLLCCIMSSNTLIAYTIVTKYGLQRHRAVTLSVGASMIALTMALISLAFIVNAVRAASGGSSSSPLTSFLFPLLKLSLYIAGTIYILPRVTRWFLQRNSDAVTQFIFVMAVMFLSAAITSFIGLEGVLGAFFSGLTLNRYIPRVSPLMNRLEFIGNALFIPYFLIGVGMLINIGALFESWHTAYVMAIIVIIGTVGKMVAGYLGSFGLRLPLTHGHMMFGLTSAHAAGSIAIVMVGIKLSIGDGKYLVDEDMLNGVVMMILFTCIISSLVTEYASQRIVLQDNLISDDDKQGDDEKILLPLKYHGNSDKLVNLAILMRNVSLNRGIIGLNVVLDDDKVQKNQALGRQLLEQAAKTASAADVRMQTQSRIATNIANGIMHAFKEYNASEIIIGLHEPKNEKDSFWGIFTESLFTRLNRQITIARFGQPLNTIRRIQVAVPSRAEFEPGFHRWIDRLARLATNLECRIQFHGRQDTLSLINQYIQNIHPNTRADYQQMPHWNELPRLAQQINEDHLFVVITARKGTVSYKSAFEKLPAELQNFYHQQNLIIIFPDQYGEAMNVMSFTAPQKREETSAYALLRNWISKRNSSHGEETRK
ncbi:MAG: cation:proton antiporter [Prevotella sp.]|nr:cation:proton antiporter [Prevotella sp.]